MWVHKDAFAINICKYHMEKTFLYTFVAPYSPVCSYLRVLCVAKDQSSAKKIIFFFLRRILNPEGLS